ncbi:probable F-box protein At5g04010 [Impatiens glandulifera]|uniref:probable F-box protein At5g04010 n=1 Tax=Impatiens glandulifera TaxID=253017 RepID=UPI001FB10B88|nr:probable F-box protein At5g04010 [Impatiens glandulifera]
MCNCSDPPWRALDLIASFLDPKTLALASCVSKTWQVSMSSDHLWEPLCLLHFPSISTLRTTDPSISFRRLYSIGHTSAIRRLRIFPEPLLTLNNLIFTVTAQVTKADTSRGSGVVNVVAMVARRLEPTLDGMFWFDLEINDGPWLSRRALNKIRLTWNVTLEGYGVIFTMLDCKESVGPGIDGWMSEELPSTMCCCSRLDGSSSGLVAEGQLEMKEKDGKVRAEKVGVGILSLVSWRYVGIEDGLRYLEHFLCT